MCYEKAARNSGFFVSIFSFKIVIEGKVKGMQSPLEFKIHRGLMDSGRNFLEILEDIESDYNDSQNALVDTINSFKLEEQDKKLLLNIVFQSCLFTQNKKTQLRKRILDRVNNTSREITEEFKKHNITLL